MSEQLFVRDADGEQVEFQEDVCAVCEGDGYYYNFEIVSGTPEFVKHKCLCKILEEMDDDANQRVKEQKENE